MKKESKRKYVKRNRSFEPDVLPKRSNTDVSPAELELPILDRPDRLKMHDISELLKTGLDKQREAAELDIELQYLKSMLQANNAVDLFYKTLSNIKEPLRQQPVQQVVRKPINNIKRSLNNIKPVVLKLEKPLKTTTQTETNGVKNSAYAMTKPVLKHQTDSAVTNKPVTKPKIQPVLNKPVVLKLDTNAKTIPVTKKPQSTDDVAEYTQKQYDSTYNEFMKGLKPDKKDLKSDKVASYKIEELRYFTVKKPEDALKPGNKKWADLYKFKPILNRTTRSSNLPNVKLVKKPSTKNNTGGIVTSVINTAKAIAKDAILKNDKLYNMTHTLFDDAPLGVKYNLVINGVSGMIDKKWGNKNEKYVSKAVLQKTTKLQQPVKTSKIKTPVEDFSDVYDKDEVTKEFVGDTVHLGNGRYALAQVKRLDDLKFAHQNRPKTKLEYNNLKDIHNSGGLLVSTFNGFEPIENARKHDKSGKPRRGLETSNTYIGVGKHDKKIYVGDLKDIPDSTYVSRAGKMIFKGFVTNNNGKTKTVPSPGNQSWSKSPVAYVQSSKDSTKTIQTPLRILAGQHGKSIDAYGHGSNNGGKFIVVTKHGNMLVQGSPRFVMNHLERLRKNQKDGKLTLIELDPGSYVKGMLKRNNVYTRRDLLDYFAQNVAGGHGLYTINDTPTIKPKRNNKK